MSTFNKRLLVIAFFTMFVACGALIFAGNQLLESWTDAEESAIETVRQCLNAPAGQQESSCGLLPYSPCWEHIQNFSEATIEVLWYNREDHIPNRGGDEVYLQVTLEDESTFGVLWYEGALESCQSGIE